jgi:hypothetical protein
MSSLENAADGSRVTGRRSEHGCRSLQVAYQAGTVPTADQGTTVQSWRRCPVPPAYTGNSSANRPSGVASLFTAGPSGVKKPPPRSAPT